MKALVTGGAGFIGSHIAEALVRAGHAVTVLDNFSLGSRGNLSWARPGDALEIVDGDAGNETMLRRVTAGCDWVFHQAALPSVPRSVAEPVASNEHNLTATLRLLEASRASGVKRLVFASSSSIYGENDAPAKHESLPPDPLSPYALQKYASETYCRMFHKFHGVPAVALRYFNVFGPRQSFNSPYSGVIARFCTLFLRGESPVIYGDGLQSRDFTYIANVVAANLAVATAPEADVAGRVFNIACGESITLLRLVADLNTLTGRNLVPTLERERPGDIRHSKADISAARQAFGFAPTVSWEDGLRRTMEWYKETEA